MTSLPFLRINLCFKFLFHQSRTLKYKKKSGLSLNSIGDFVFHVEVSEVVSVTIGYRNDYFSVISNAVTVAEREYVLIIKYVPRFCLQLCFRSNKYLASSARNMSRHACKMYVIFPDFHQNLECVERQIFCKTFPT
jgi:hypothetical protein